ncbi:YiiD C-terminal domain-containing protein [Sphingomonas sp. PR090111-T3T-6A]|uniref:YiiD C-terminal domain-containing protein n=1 Tax=Sphingomonas sp. PR090111-T3T-6A TaxID=685778 RepID=UPI00036FA628|nr:YiiD C-terminal domain-containing protein [Sphingomonas sp. PR090111-T3T-6A]
MMDAAGIGALEDYLHRQIPLSAAMQVSVRFASAESVVLHAPLEPNINHKSTLFGGSASAIATLAAWTLLHVRLRAAEIPCHLVIQSNRMDYDRPVLGAFEARATLPDPDAWPGFLAMLVRRKRARIEAQSVLLFDGEVAGRFEGRFVALLA